MTHPPFLSLSDLIGQSLFSDLPVKPEDDRGEVKPEDNKGKDLLFRAMTFPIILPFVKRNISLYSLP
ncbi:MAG: hypothetical protein IKA03_05550, partial [Alphaproteobacteria bacterium]|nr:hypothetical protein [Alphaproteobacteria bacterium]